MTVTDSNTWDPSDQGFPTFSLDADNITVLYSPVDFYTELLNMYSTARRRIALAALYVGSGQPESHVMNAIANAVENARVHPLFSEAFEVDILIDATRGTRKELLKRPAESSHVSDPNRATARSFECPTVISPTAPAVSSSLHMFLPLFRIQKEEKTRCAETRAPTPPHASSYFSAKEKLTDAAQYDSIATETQTPVNAVPPTISAYPIGTGFSSDRRSPMSDSHSPTMITKIVHKRDRPSVSVRIHCFHSPLLSGFLYKLLPERINEVLGVFHTKIFLADDTVILTGANLSDCYLTSRQDRYILIRNQPHLADFLQQFIRTVQRFSYAAQLEDVSSSCVTMPLSSRSRRIPLDANGSTTCVLSLDPATPCPISQPLLFRQTFSQCLRAFLNAQLLQVSRSPRKPKQACSGFSTTLSVALQAAFVLPPIQQEKALLETVLHGPFTVLEPPPLLDLHRAPQLTEKAQLSSDTAKIHTSPVQNFLFQETGTLPALLRCSSSTISGVEVVDDKEHAPERSKTASVEYPQDGATSTTTADDSAASRSSFISAPSLCSTVSRRSNKSDTPFESQMDYYCGGVSLQAFSEMGHASPANASTQSSSDNESQTLKKDRRHAVRSRSAIQKRVVPANSEASFPRINPAHSAGISHTDEAAKIHPDPNIPCLGKVVVASGYLNMDDDLLHYLATARSTTCSSYIKVEGPHPNKDHDDVEARPWDLEVFVASPAANSFFQSKGVSQYIPMAYSYVEGRQLQRLQYLWKTTKPPNSSKDFFSVINSSTLLMRRLNCWTRTRYATVYGTAKECLLRMNHASWCYRRRNNTDADSPDTKLQHPHHVFSTQITRRSKKRAAVVALAHDVHQQDPKRHHKTHRISGDQVTPSSAVIEQAPLTDCQSYSSPISSLTARCSPPVFWEYNRHAWTFHSKGMWLYPPTPLPMDCTSSSTRLPEDTGLASPCFPHLPVATIIGSSNFGLRACSRDLDTSFFLRTNDPRLRAQLHLEVERMRPFCSQIRQVQRLMDRCPTWLRTLLRWTSLKTLL